MIPTKPRQMPLDLESQPGFSRDELVVTGANNAAVTLIDSWPAWPASLMVLAGPPGSGKTHLATIWAQRAGATVLSAQSLGTHAGTALENILIDGVDGANLDDTALFHLINGVRQAGASMLITSRSWPTQWPVTLPDLVSRIKSAPTVEISEPDDALLSGVITKLFADRQLVVEPQLVSYLVARIERSLATAQNVVERLDKAGLEAKARISRQMAATILTQLDLGQTTLDL